MKTCPHCKGLGYISEVVTNVATLLSEMRNHVPAKDIYEGQDGKFYLTYGGGPIDPGIIQTALDQHAITPKWDDRPDLKYWRVAPEISS